MVVYLLGLFPHHVTTLHRLWEGLKPLVQRGNMQLKPLEICLTVALVFYGSSGAVINSSPSMSLQLLRGGADSYCNRSCHSDVDCNQAGGCMPETSAQTLFGVLRTDICLDVTVQKDIERNA